MSNKSFTSEDIESSNSTLAESNYIQPYENDETTDVEDHIELPVIDKLDSAYVNGVPYTILEERERFFFAIILGIVGLCSSFSMPIYWPALPEIVKAFNSTEEKINYTITAYLVFQAVSPVFISSLSDVFGRRPIVIICMIGGVCVNIGLACTRTYWLLIFLRCLLAAFVAPLVSITAAAVGDFSTKRNRGSLTGWTLGLTLSGQAIAPFMGAVMDTVWGWPAIFWFSAAIEGTFLVMFFILVPETNRRFVGNMGHQSSKWYHWSPALWYFESRMNDPDGATITLGKARYNPWKPLSLIAEPKVLFILLPCSIQFGSWTIAQTSMSIGLQNAAYGYKTLAVGICFFSPGFASLFGTLGTGRILDYIYRHRKQSYMNKYRSDLEKDMEVPPFNIINCRLLPFIPFAIIVASCTVAFGWCLGANVHLAVILVLQFIITLFSMYPLSVVNTVLLDMFPNISGGVTALNNLFRCGMASIFVSCLSKMEDSMTIGGTYTLMMGLVLSSCGLVLILMKQSQQLLEKDLAKN